MLTTLGCIYIIAMYYKRYELQWRLNVFFSASILAGAVSGVCLSHVLIVHMTTTKTSRLTNNLEN